MTIELLLGGYPHMTWTSSDQISLDQRMLVTLRSLVAVQHPGVALLGNGEPAESAHV